MDHRQSLDGGKPELSIRGLATGGLKATGTLQRAQAFGLPINQTIHRLQLAVGAPVQLLLGNPEDSTVGTDPEIPLTVIEDMADPVIRQPFARGNGCEPSVPQTAQAAAKGPHPERAIFLGQQRPHKIIGQSVLPAKLRELALFEPAQASARHAKPDGRSEEQTS